jgi:hypothetical protein
MHGQILSFGLGRWKRGGGCSRERRLGRSQRGGLLGLRGLLQWKILLPPAAERLVKLRGGVICLLPDHGLLDVFCSESMGGCLLFFLVIQGASSPINISIVGWAASFGSGKRPLSSTSIIAAAHRHSRVPMIGNRLSFYCDAC